MNAVFYNISCPYDVLDKTNSLGTGSQATLQPYEPIDDLSGHIIVSSDYINNNYVKLSMTGKDRYFFVTSREPMTGQRFRLNLEEDVLMTWKDDIKSTPGIIGRSNVGSSKDFRSDIPLFAFSRMSEDAGPSFEYGTADHLSMVLVSASQSWDLSFEDSGGLIGDYQGHAGGGASGGW